MNVVSVSDALIIHPEVIIVDANSAHIRELRETIRDQDKHEIESYGFSCARGLWRSFRGGLMNKTALIDGRVAAIWGVGGTFMGETGQPWLMTSDEVRKISPLKFARLYKKEVDKMLELFPRLENYVSESYHESIRMLSIVGFTIGEPERVGNGMFRKFTLTRGE